MNLRTYALAGVLALSATGCDSLLDTEPKQSVSPETALGSLPLYRNLLAGGYNRLQGAAAYGQSLILAPEALADNAVLSVNTGRYTADLINTTGTGVGGWATWYALVNDANFILSGIDAVAGDENTKNQIRGEAYFLRGLAFHNLARIYSYEPGVGSFDAGIVIRTTPTREPADAAPKARSTRAETYAQIKSDLTAARTAFQAVIAGPDATLGRNVYLGSLAGTEALLSRVHLYAREWAQAETFATAALASAPGQTRAGASNRAGGAVLTTAATHPASFARQAGVAHPESLFEVVIVNNVTEGLGINTAINSLLSPTAGGFYSLRAAPELTALFGTGDVRLALYPVIGTTTTRSVNKFPGSLGNFADNIPVIRVAEMYLNRAEARAEQGNLAGALSDLNTLRAARGLAEFTAGSPGAALTEILIERRRELAFEGHRFFDIKRRGLDLVKPASSAVGTISANDFRFLSPIPADQVQLAGGVLVQNPGY